MDKITAWEPPKIHISTAMVSSFTIKICLGVMLLAYLHGTTVDAIFNDHLDSLINVLHHGQQGGGVAGFLSRLRNTNRNNNNKNHNHDHDDDYDDDHDHDHGNKGRGSTRTNGKSRGSKRIKIRGKVNCTCSVPKQSQLNSDVSHGNSEVSHGNSDAVNGLNGIQNVEVLQAIIRALINSGTQQGIDDRYEHLGLLCFPNITLTTNNF